MNRHYAVSPGWYGDRARLPANMRLVEIVGHQARQLRVTWPARLKIDSTQVALYRGPQTRVPCRRFS